MMNETPESIKQQIEKTKASLALKFEVLRQQTTIDAVDEIMSAVQHSVRSAAVPANIRRQLSQHRWWFLGGSLAVASLIFGHRFWRLEEHPNSKETDSSGPSPIERALVRHKLREAAINSFLSVLPAIASRVAPLILEQVIDNWPQVKLNPTETADDGPIVPCNLESQQTIQQDHTANSGTLLS